MLLKTVTATVLVCFLSACASPTVVQSKQSRDSEMSCDQLKAANAEAQDFESKARKERGVTGTNVAAAILFWPAMIGTYKNTEEAMEAAKDSIRIVRFGFSAASAKIARPSKTSPPGDFIRIRTSCPRSSDIRATSSRASL